MIRPTVFIFHYNLVALKLFSRTPIKLTADRNESPRKKRKRRHSKKSDIGRENIDQNRESDKPNTRSKKRKVSAGKELEQDN